MAVIHAVVHAGTGASCSAPCLKLFFLVDLILPVTRFPMLDSRELCSLGIRCIVVT
jgi:hypothetical protein